MKAVSLNAVLGLTFIPMIAFAGSEGKADYIWPTTRGEPNNSIIVNKSKAMAWNAVIPELGKTFFVINTLDKTSGLINLTYNVDPEVYIDCGRIVSYVEDSRGHRTYDFPAAKAQQKYEILRQGTILVFDRTMSLTGRINVVFEELGPNQTKVTANAMYVVSRNQTWRKPNGSPETKADSINFGSGQSGGFVRPDGTTQPVCYANGMLEDAVLSLLKAADR